MNSSPESEKESEKAQVKKVFEKISDFAWGLNVIWTVTGITLLLVLALEGGLTGFFALKDRPAQSASSDAKPDNLQDRLKEYFDEISQAHNLEWKPYVYWRRKPFKGKYITIGPEGIRKTWNRQAALGEGGSKPARIFMFGGSTMWGYGARDDFTIPSYLSRMIAKGTEYNAQVTNMAETGFVSTQEMIFLSLELQKENRPDIAVFYDGINDVAAALLNKEAGVFFHELNRRAEFNLTNEKRSRDLYKASLSRFWRSSGIFRAVSYLKGVKEVPPPYRVGSEGAEKLAKDVAELYASTVKLTEKIGRMSAIDTIFYWQPVVFTKDPLSFREKEMVEELKLLDYFHKRVNDHIRSNEYLRNNPNFHDITDFFNGKLQRHYIDYMHLAEPGNALIAQRMLKDIAAILNRR